MSVWVLCLIAAATWAIAPLMGRAMSAPPMILATLIATGTMVALLPVAFTQDFSVVSWKDWIIGLAAGVFNGIGVLAFYSLIAGSISKGWEISNVLPIVYVLVPIILMVGARVFFGEEITRDKVIGITLACSAIWFLK